MKIQISKSTKFKGETLKKGTELQTPKDLRQDEANFLVKIGNAKDITNEEKPVEIATEQP